MNFTVTWKAKGPRSPKRHGTLNSSTDPNALTIQNYSMLKKKEATILVCSVIWQTKVRDKVKHLNIHLRIKMTVNKMAL